MPEGLGLDPTGFSHVLSARGLDVLDDGLEPARQAMAKDPTAEHIERFSDLEEQFRENGGYEAESVMARLADGLGPAPGPAARGHRRASRAASAAGSTSSGSSSRQPDIMVLDEPTNHLDRPAKTWLMDELERFPGASWSSATT